MRLRLSCVNSGKYNATFFYSAPPDRVEEIYRQRLPPNQYTIERVNVLCVLHRSARTSVKNLLDFRLREDEEALEKGRKFLLFFSLFDSPSSLMNASRRRYTNADDNGEAQNKMRSHYVHS